MKSMVLALLLLPSLALASCVSSKSCATRADEQYRACANPGFTGARDEQPGPTRGDTSQECRATYLQAMARCGEAPAAPVPDLTPDGGAQR